MRLLLALLVIYGHTFHLGGYDVAGDVVSRWSSGEVNAGTLAVFGFFVISGYLVAQSLQCSDSWAHFFLKRTLRIFPAFWVGLAVSALIVAPVLYVAREGSLSGFIGEGPDGPVRYILSNSLLTMCQWGIRGLLSEVPHAGSFNGTCWTLIYEFLCYFGLFAVMWPLRKSRYVVPAVVGVYMLFWLTADYEGTKGRLLLWFYVRGPASHFAPLFFGGALAYLYRDRLPLRRSLFALSTITWIVALRYDNMFAATPGLVYSVLYCCLRGRVVIDRWGDYSYGIYIFGFTAQQLIARYGLGKDSWPLFLFWSIALTAPLAALSWHVIEKPALMLKNIGRTPAAAVRWPDR